ncbi:MAG: VUT family protein [Alphaproteobacteria bacterium]|nr:VUT family protein [Alphaproteobacteria bacterium]
MFKRDIHLKETGTDHEWHPRYIDIVACLYICTNMITWVIADKLWVIGPFTFSAATLVYPLTCVFGDILTEIYGFNRTRRLIWAGFGCGLLFLFFVQIAIMLPPSPDYKLQEAFSAANSGLPRIIIASYIAYVFCEFTNSYIMSKMKLWSRGDNFPLRALVSTLGAQLVDSSVFFVVAFAGNIPTHTIIMLILGTWIAKSLYEAILLPLTTISVKWLKTREGVEHFDRYRLTILKF